MEVAPDAAQAANINAKLLQKWDEVRSSLHESGHRLNSRYAEARHAGENMDPNELLQYLIKTYETAAAMAVRTVADHDSALICAQELDVYLKNLLKVSTKLFRVVLRRNSCNSSPEFTRELRRRLLSRSEHWKAEAHKMARSAARARYRMLKRLPVISHENLEGRSKAGDSTPLQSKSVAQNILYAAMENQGLNPPKLAVKVRAILQRRKETRVKVDRATIYRILQGKTKRPHPAIRNGLIEALHLEGVAAETVRFEFGKLHKGSASEEN